MKSMQLNGMIQGENGVAKTLLLARNILPTNFEIGIESSLGSYTTYGELYQAK